jgi:hypothetical protein
MDPFLNKRLLLDTDLHRFQELNYTEWILILVKRKFIFFAEGD